MRARALSRLCGLYWCTMNKLVGRAQFQRYQKHYCTTCVTGLFGCRWHRFRQSRRDTTRVDLIWYTWLVLCVFFATFVLYYWILVGNDYDDFVWYLYDNTGNLWPIYTAVLTLTCIFSAYVFLLFILSLCHVILGHEIYLHWSHRGFLIVSVIFGSLILILLNNVYNHGWELLRISFMITAPFLQLSGVVILTCMSYFIAKYFYLLRDRYVKAAYITVFVTVMITLYISPVFIDSPCICKQDDLPSAPYLVAHRGASAIVPENTLEAFVEAAKYRRVLAFESDVTVSWDGVPFLMHDRTLVRTTDVANKFPSRKADCACTFNISEIRELNAGKWFVKTNPHSTLSEISNEKQNSYKQLQVPTLRELLELMKEHRKKFLFDIQTYEYGIPSNHPHITDYGDVIIREIQASGVNQKDVLWLYKEALNTTVPHEFTIIKGKLETHQQLLNIEDYPFNVPYHKATYKDVRTYLGHNATTNVWVVNSKWLYSLYWCMGVHSITTNFVHSFSEMSTPSWHLTPTEYEALWVVCDFVSAIVIIIMFIVLFVRNNPPETIQHEIQHARDHMAEKHRQKKYMREKLIKNSSATSFDDGTTHENAALDGAGGSGFDTRSIDSTSSSVTADAQAIGHQMVKLEDLARDYSIVVESAKNSPRSPENEESIS